MRSLAPRPARRGFTLMEILLSTLLFSVMTVCLHTTYQAMNRTMAQCQRGFGAQLEMMRFDKIVVPLLMSASPQAQKNTESTFKGDQRTLTFTTLNAMRYGEGACPIATVSLSHDRDKGLIVTVNPYLYLSKDAPEAVAQVHQFPSFKELEIRYQTEDDEKREWDALQTGNLPRVVVLAAKVETFDGKEIPITRYVAVPMVRDLPIAGIR